MEPFCYTALGRVRKNPLIESINIMAVGLRESLLDKGRRPGRSHDFPGRQEDAFN